MDICLIIILSKLTFFSVHEDETDAFPCDFSVNGETTEMYEIPIHNGEKNGWYCSMLLIKILVLEFMLILNTVQIQQITYSTW